MSDPLRYILVGVGSNNSHWCRTTLPRLRDMGKAVAAAAIDVSADRLKYAQLQLDLPPQYCFTDAAEAFERRAADFAIIAAPTPFHERFIDLALTFDQHVLIDSPLIDTMEGALRIYSKVKHAKKRAAVISHPRYDQDKQTLLSLINSRRFGRLNYIVCRFTENNRRAPAWGRYRHEMQDPLLIEAAISHIDVFRSLAGSNAKSVYTVSWNPPWGEYRGDSTALLSFEMESGAYAMYEGAKANASSLNGWNNEYFRAECEQATIELDRRQIRIISNSALDASRIDEAPLLEQPVWGATWLTEQFCDWLCGGPDVPNTLKDHVRCSATVFAAVESARTGKAVDVRAFLRRYIDSASAD